MKREIQQDLFADPKPAKAKKRSKPTPYTAPSTVTVSGDTISPMQYCISYRDTLLTKDTTIIVKGDEQRITQVLQSTTKLKEQTE